MRLLNTRTLKLETFFSLPPTYAILSHTWGADEPTFDDMAAGTADQRAGYQKIVHSSKKAVKRDISYIWIDTICINKSSSSELSEAINSMYRYYQRARICFAFLEDTAPGDQVEEKMLASKWWTRGWTLQELLAPRHLTFYSRDWTAIGTKAALALRISQATRIDEHVLQHSKPLRSVSVAKRMSWAANRKTTRDEDIAYCLLGIFAVNMPLLYGEGMNAFSRLQEEMMRESSDQSLFAWTLPWPTDTMPWNRGILAPHPKCFSQSANVVPFEGAEQLGTGTEPYTMTNQGLRIRLPIIQNDGKRKCVAVLACHRDGDWTGPLGIKLRPIMGSGGEVFMRDISARNISPRVVDLDRMSHAKVRSIYIAKRSSTTETLARRAWLRKVPSSFKAEFKISDLHAGCFFHWHQWDTTRRSTTSTTDETCPPAQHTGAVIFRDECRPRFGIVFAVDSTDRYSTDVEIHVAPEVTTLFASFIHNMTKTGKFGQRKRIASAKIGLKETITVVASWDKIMNSEVLVFDITIQDAKKDKFNSLFSGTILGATISCIALLYTGDYMDKSRCLFFLAAAHLSNRAYPMVKSFSKWSAERLGTWCMWLIPLKFVLISLVICLFSLLAGSAQSMLSLPMFCYGGWVLYAQRRVTYTLRYGWKFGGFPVVSLHNSCSFL
jgi:hypothetical protein